MRRSVSTWTPGELVRRSVFLGRSVSTWTTWALVSLVDVHLDDGELRPGPQGYAVSLPGEMPPPWSRLSCSASCPRSFSSSSATYCSRS